VTLTLCDATFCSSTDSGRAKKEAENKRGRGRAWSGQPRGGCRSPPPPAPVPAKELTAI
jgi:hypothetical protein